MIAHTILFKPRGSLPIHQRRAILDALAAAVKRLPTVRGCRIGRRVRHGLPGYEQLMREDYEYLLQLEFDDIDGLRGYLTHPAHAQLGDFFTTAADASLAYDYEMMSLDAAQRAL